MKNHPLIDCRVLLPVGVAMVVLWVSISATTGADRMDRYGRNRGDESRYGGSRGYEEDESLSAQVKGIRSAFLEGEYEKAIRLCERAEKRGDRGESVYEWWLRALLTTGQYAEAETVLERATRRHSYSIRLQLLAREVYRYAGEGLRADLALRQINYLVERRPWGYRSSPDQIALGQAALEMGADPRLVLENFYRPVQQEAKNQAEEEEFREEPGMRRAWLAVGELALRKHDYNLAAKTFQEGLARFVEDPELLYGLARAFAPSDRRQMASNLEKALEINPRHTGTLLLWADHLIDAEEYEEAEKKLEKVLEVNPHHPEAWAYRAVMAHLEGEYAKEAEARQKALTHWTANPEVDYLIGKKLSQKYRFAKGAAYQRRALDMDPDYIPSQIHLAQDLLRLGKEDGWRLVEDVHEKDAYDVTAFNLASLRDKMATFESLRDDRLVVRMDPGESVIYGDRAVSLLRRAWDQLTQKYGMRPEEEVVVEIFPSQEDFAVRTFGMPGNPGYLGVCFGSVVTANSPAARQGTAVNWEAVLWHEFCHVVTLQLTRNKMPRWLSEGISVYEERQANEAWGQWMTPEYRHRIVEGEMTPVGELSSAFLAPGSGEDLQFAYYQSSLVVEYLVQEHGLDALKGILLDLAADDGINEAIEGNTAPLKQVEEGFQAYALAKAQEMGPGLDWEKPREKVVQPGEMNWESLPENNYWRLMHEAMEKLAEEDWQGAKKPLERVAQEFPRDTGSEGALRLLARVYQETGEEERELELLKILARHNGEVPDVYVRLMEIGKAQEDWEMVWENVQRLLAVNPLRRDAYRFLSEAGESLGREEAAMGAYRHWLQLGPMDPALVHFRYGKLLRSQSKEGAKRQVLMALEEAPRFQEAQRLLLELVREEEKKLEAKDESEPKKEPAPLAPTALE